MALKTLLWSMPGDIGMRARMPCTCGSAFRSAISASTSSSSVAAGNAWLKYAKPTVPVFFSIWPR